MEGFGVFAGLLGGHVVDVSVCVVEDVGVFFSVFVV